MGRGTDRGIEARPMSRYARYEQFQQAGILAAARAHRIPYGGSAELLSRTHNAWTVHRTVHGVFYLPSTQGVASSTDQHRTGWIWVGVTFSFDRFFAIR